MKNIIIILLLLPVLCFGQRKRITPTGAVLRESPFTTITGSSEQNLFADTLVANTLPKFMKATFKISCNITTGVGLSTLTVRFVNGSNSVILLSGLNVSLSQANKPFIITGNITNQGNGNAYLYLTISQDGAVPINTITSYYDKRAIIPVDFSVNQPIYVKVQIGGIGLGATTVGVDEIERTGFN